jgi:hypothetical protein
MNRSYLLIFLLVLSFTIVSAVPPVTTIDYFPTGYIITEAHNGIIKLNEDFTYNFILYNSSTGLDINNTSVICRILISDNQGELVYHNNVSYNSYNYWSVFIPGSVFNKTGYYPYGVDCEDGKGGALAGSFYITQTGTLLDISDSILYASFLFIIFIIMYGLIKLLLESENKYFNYGIISILYILSNVFLLIFWKVSEYFLYLVPFISTLFEILYKVSTIGYFIIFPVILFSLAMSLFNDKEMLKLQEMGYSDEDISRVRSSKR